VDEVGAELRHHHPESFRPVKVSCRNGEERVFFAFTKVVRLKRYGRKRLVVVHEQEDLTDAPRFLLTAALHWESGRVIQTWSYRWASEVFHEFGKQVCGLESAQVRKEEAVIRHFRLSCVSRVVAPTRTCPRVEIRKICVCRREENLRSEVPSDLPGSIALPAGTMQAVFCRGQILQ
jgi:hypothetical protein